MNPEVPAIPLPKEPRHRLFADFVLSGKPLVEAYLEAGFRCTRATANANAKKLRKRPDLQAYIRAVQAAAAHEATLSLHEILRFCARVVRTPIARLDPRNPADPNGDLIKSFASNDGELSSSFRLEKHDPFKAIDTHLKLSGHDPEADAMRQLAAALAALGHGQPMPEDRM